MEMEIGNNEFVWKTNIVVLFLFLFFLFFLVIPCWWAALALFIYLFTERFKTNLCPSSECLDPLCLFVYVFV